MKTGYIVFTAIALLAMSAKAQEKYFQVNNEIYPCAVSVSEFGAAAYNDSAKCLSIDYKDGHCVWTTDVIGNIDVTESPCENLFSSTADWAVLANNKVSELIPVVEIVPKDKNDPEYEDFIENYVRSCKVTVTYSGNKASVTVVPSDYGVVKSVKGADVVLSINDKKVQVIASGSSDNGSLKIYSENKFRLDLDNLTLTSPTGPAINIQSGKRAYLNLPDGSANTLKSGDIFAKQLGPDGVEEDAKATLFSEGQLIFSGSGSLAVSSSANHGICSDDYIRFRSSLGNVTISSSKDGIHANKCFRMYGGTLSVEAGDNGVQVEKGDASFYGGICSVSSTNHGIYVKSDSLPVGYVRVSGKMNLSVSSKESSAVFCKYGFYADGGFVLLQSRGLGGRGIRSNADIVLNNCLVATELMDSKPGWNAETVNYTQPSGLRAAGSITLDNALLGCYLTGDTRGAKVLNADSSLVISNSIVNIDACQEDFDADGEIVKSKAVEGHDIVIDDKSLVYIKAGKRAISSETNIDINNSVVKMTSDFSWDGLMKSEGSIACKGAVFYNKLITE